MENFETPQINQYFKVQSRKEISTPFKVQTGLRQNETLLPMSFNITTLGKVTENVKKVKWTYYLNKK